MPRPTMDVNSPEYQATMQQYADTQSPLMQQTGEMGPGAEPSLADQAPGEEVAETETETEEAPYGINPNTGEPYPAPRGQVKGAEALSKLARR